MADISRIQNHPAANQPLPDADANADLQSGAAEALDPKARLSAAQQAELAALAGAAPAQMAPLSGASSPAPHTDAPPLPEVEGVAGSDAAAARALPSWLQSKKYSFSAGLELLSDLAADYQIQAGAAKRLAGTANYQLQMQGVNAVREQVDGERQNAINKLVTATVATVASASLGAGGVHLANSGGKPATGAAMQAAGQSVGTFINAAGDAISKLVPNQGQYKADEARILKAVIDALVSVDKATEDAMNSTQDQARKAQQSLIDWKRSVDDKRDQVNMSVANNA